MKEIILFLFSYLLGSFPTAYILVKKTKNIDIRKIGSGNPGATNVVRTSGLFLGIITLVVDFLKGFVPVLIAKTYFSINLIPLVIMFTVIGHIFSVFLIFRGGKGVATFFGGILGISYKIFFVCALVFVVVLVVSRYVSLSSVLSVAVFEIIILNFNNFSYYNKIILLLIPLIIIFRHRDNIIRILNSQETRIF